MKGMWSRFSNASGEVEALISIAQLPLKSVEARHGQMTQKRARRVADKERMRAAAYLDLLCRYSWRSAEPDLFTEGREDHKGLITREPSASGSGGENPPTHTRSPGRRTRYRLPMQLCALAAWRRVRGEERQVSLGTSIDPRERARRPEETGILGVRFHPLGKRLN
jgi:hypothetical protein